MFNTLRSIGRHPLVKGRELSAYAKFFRWHITARISKSPQKFQWINNTWFYSGVMDRALNGNIFCGLSDYAEMGFLLHYLRPGDAFLDVGANAGVYSVLASGACGAHSYAFEPVPQTVHRLRANIDLNNISHLAEIFELGVADRAGSLQFTSSCDAKNGVISGDSACEQIVELRVAPLDSIQIHQNEVVMKVDVEGYEYNVLTGAENLLDEGRVKAIVIEQNGSGRKFGIEDADITDFIVSKGFVEVEYDPAGRRLSPVSSSHQRGSNAIFVRNFEEADALCNKAAKFQIHTAGSVSL